MYLDTDVILALVKDEDWLKEAAERKIRGHRPLRTSALGVLEAQLVLEREGNRQRALEVGARLRRRRIAVLPLDARTLREADRLRREIPVLHLFDGVHLASARAVGDVVLSSDRLFPLLRIVPIEPLP